MIQILADASGTAGMAGGQAIDLAAVGRALTLEELEAMHRLKTGALIRASVLMAAACSPALSAANWDALDGYAQDIGLAFQIQDDILDVEGKTEEIGKTSGADAARAKPTYPSVLGPRGRQDPRSRTEAARLRKARALGRSGQRPGVAGLLRDRAPRLRPRSRQRRPNSRIRAVRAQVPPVGRRLLTHAPQPSSGRMV